MEARNINDYTYMVISKNNQLDSDVKNVLGNVFGLKKVQNDVNNAKSDLRDKIDIALIDNESSDFDDVVQNWGYDKADKTKLILIGAGEKSDQLTSPESDKYIFISKSALRHELLTIISRLIIDLEIEKYQLRQTYASNKEVFVKGESMYYRLNLDRVEYVEAYGNYVKIHYSDGSWTIGNCSIKSIEEQLSSSDFCRIHRSYIVQIDRVSNFNSVNLEINSKILPIGRHYKKDFESRLIKL